MRNKIIHPLTVVMKCKMSYIDQNHFLHQAVNMFFFSAVNLGILTWGGGGGVYGIDSLLQLSLLASRERVGGCDYGCKISGVFKIGNFPWELTGTNWEFVQLKKLRT